jgi:NADH:ubiquinone oxidoreductase subunit F (NADH-binding)
MTIAIIGEHEYPLDDSTPVTWPASPLPGLADQVAPLPRLLAGLAGGSSRRAGLNAHERLFGPLPLPVAATANGYGWNLGDSAKPRRGRGAASQQGRAARRAAARLIDVVERSGLTGRGGAGFPTGRKLRSVAAGGGPTVVVANGAEGEPASRKDRVLLTRAPHLVLDGITLAAFAVGATRAFLAVHDELRLVADLEAAIAARNVAGIDPVPVEVVGIEPRYTASEQTSIVQYLNGGPALPTFAPPRTHERGVAGRPTAVSNVETLAHLALIARYGDRWFRQAGLPDSPGTALVTVTGEVAFPGVYEIELGTPVGDVVHRAGGPTERPQAVLVGGYFGTWLAADVAWPAPMSHPGLRSVGAAMGAGILVVLGESSCGLAETARVQAYLARHGAGQCGPCVFGLPALAGAASSLAFHGDPAAADRATRLIPLIEGRGACRHPDGATSLASSAFRAFAHDVRWHAERGPCHGMRRPPVLPVPPDLEYW